jgi:hypothetical protein
MYDDVRELVTKSDGPFAVINCVCRQAKDKLGDSCKLTDIRETGVMFEDMASITIGNGLGRKITKDETLELFDRAEREGMILQPENNKKPMFVCCCCCLCTTACKVGAITLKKRSKEWVPPKDHDALYKKIMVQKLRPWGTLQMMGKSLLGKNF